MDMLQAHWGNSGGEERGRERDREFMTKLPEALCICSSVIITSSYIVADL